MASTKQLLQTVVCRGDLTGHCASCKHWTAFEQLDRISDATATGVDRRALGLCRAIGQERYEVSDDPSAALAQVEDLSDEATLRTAADFGCVLWAVRRRGAAAGFARFLRTGGRTG